MQDSSQNPQDFIFPYEIFLSFAQNLDSRKVTRTEHFATVSRGKGLLKFGIVFIASFKILTHLEVFLYLPTLFGWFRRKPIFLSVKDGWTRW